MNNISQALTDKLDFMIDELGSNQEVDFSSLDVSNQDSCLESVLTMIHEVSSGTYSLSSKMEELVDKQLERLTILNRSFLVLKEFHLKGRSLDEFDSVQNTVELDIPSASSEVAKRLFGPKE